MNLRTATATIVFTQMTGEHMNTLDAVVEVGRGRRRHSEEFKARVVQACDQPGVSAASVALSHGLNANMVRRWVADRMPESQSLVGSPRSVSRSKPGPVRQGKFVPVKLEAGCDQAQDIHVELRRGQTTMMVRWPRQEAATCVSWLREWLR